MRSDERGIKNKLTAGRLMARDISESLGKLPPQAPDLEEAVLGAMMLEKNALINVMGVLRPEHFYVEAHKIIFEAIQTLFGAGDPVDMRTVVAQLRKSGKLELIEGAHKIALLTSKVSSAANIEYHARIVIEMAVKRSLIEIASWIHTEAYDETVDVFSLYEKANLAMQDVLDKAIGNRAEQPIKLIAVEVVQDVQARMTGVHTGLDSGFEQLDRLLNGFNKTDLIIVAARPGMGKTAFVVQALKQIAERGEKVGVFSLEMSAKQLVERLAIAGCEVDGEKVRKGARGGLSEVEFTRFTDAAGTMMNLGMYIDDTPMLSVVELRARAMRMKTKYGVSIIAIDYLQLMRGTQGFGPQNRDQEIGQITRTLKGIAKELDIPVIALSQLNRGVETRGGDKRPALSDLRESGSIEQDADVVMFLYRPEYYKITVDADGLPTHGLCEVIVAKHRNGSLDTVKLKFKGLYTKFLPWDGVEAGYTPRGDQTEYIKKHVKSVLPSDRTDEDFAKEDAPF